LREEHRLRVFENRMLGIFGPKREVEGSWRKLHNDELHSLYSSPNILRVIKLSFSRTMFHRVSEMQAEIEADHLLYPRAKVKNVWRFTSMDLRGFMPLMMVNK
jgi:hypothetical protein